MMHWPLDKQAQRINQILRGHYNYFGLPGNARRLHTFHHAVNLNWKRVLDRRSQRAGHTWEQHAKVMQRFPLSHPRLKLTYATIKQYVRL